MVYSIPLINFKINLKLLPCLLIDFKNSKWLTYFYISWWICYCFLHSDWFIFCHIPPAPPLEYKITLFFIHFCFSDEGPMLETLDFAFYTIYSIYYNYIYICLRWLPLVSWKVKNADFNLKNWLWIFWKRMKLKLCIE